MSGSDDQLLLNEGSSEKSLTYLIFKSVWSFVCLFTFGPLTVIKFEAVSGGDDPLLLNEGSSAKSVRFQPFVEFKSVEKSRLKYRSSDVKDAGKWPRQETWAIDGENYAVMPLHSSLEDVPKKNDFALYFLFVRQLAGCFHFFLSYES